MRVRLVSYNIMTGGEGRADPIAEVLLAQRADIIGLHECENAEVLSRLARRLEMQFVVAQSVSGTVALFTKHTILASLNVAMLQRSSMPILDAVVKLTDESGLGWTMPVRVAHVTHAGEADRMAEKLGGGRVPLAMLMCYEPPLGHRVIDGVVNPSTLPVPEKTHAPVRQLNAVLIRNGIEMVESWIEADRMAYYASDHLPAGAEIEYAP